MTFASGKPWRQIYQIQDDELWIGWGVAPGDGAPEKKCPAAFKGANVYIYKRAKQ